MKLLVTRPRPDADATAVRLREKGHDPVLAPLMEVAPVSPPEDFPPAGVQAYLVTSANGARALCAATPERETPVLAVGAATAAAMRDGGFRQVESADGDVDTLAALARDTLDPAAGPLVHAVGSVSAGNLAGRLAPHGFDARVVVLYDAVTLTELPAAARDALQSGTLDGVLLYSPRTATTFRDLVNAAGLKESLAHLVAYCLSRAVADRLDEHEFSDVRVASRPDQVSLFDLLRG